MIAEPNPAQIKCGGFTAASKFHGQTQAAAPTAHGPSRPMRWPHRSGDHPAHRRGRLLRQVGAAFVWYRRQACRGIRHRAHRVHRSMTRSREMTRKSIRIVRLSVSTLTSPALCHASSNPSLRDISRVQTAALYLAAFGSITAAVSKNMRCTTTPPRVSHVAAATIPPERVTRRISRTARSGSGTNCRTRDESVWSKEASSKRSRVTSPTSKRTRGSARCLDAWAM